MIGVVVPAHNEEGHVRACLESVLFAAEHPALAGQAVSVVVVLDEQIPDVRPGFTCTADITSATRKNVAAVPIPAVAVRELVYDANNQIVKAPKDPRRKRPGVEPVAVAAELKPGQTRKETEGVFVARNGVVEFVPIKLGISGDKYFEVLDGLKPADEGVTGPYNSVRNMTDGDPVKVDTTKGR